MKIPYEGELCDAEEVRIESMEEGVNSYRLDDGSVIKARNVFVEVVRLLDRYDKDGQPVYVVKSQNIVSVSAPEELRRPV